MKKGIVLTISCVLLFASGSANPQACPPGCGCLDWPITPCSATQNLPCHPCMIVGWTNCADWSDWKYHGATAYVCDCDPDESNILWCTAQEPVHCSTETPCVAGLLYPSSSCGASGCTIFGILPCKNCAALDPPIKNYLSSTTCESPY